MSKPSALLFGPYVGEFGCELTHWNPWVRWKVAQWKSNNPEGRIVVSARSDRRWWYDDFADEFIPCPDVSIRRARGPFPHTKFDWDPETFFEDLGIEGKQISPIERKSIHKYWRQRKWRDLSLESDYTPMVLLHYRNLPKCKGRNCHGHEEWWGGLATALRTAGVDLSRVASVGHLEGSRPVPGTFDMRGIPLEEFGKLVSRAIVMVGPSSGPMHLAQLSRRPVVVWGNRRVHQLFVPGPGRLQGKANPFDSPTSFELTSDTWNVSKTLWRFPSHEWVARTIRHYEEEYHRQLDGGIQSG